MALVSKTGNVGSVSHGPGEMYSAEVTYTNPPPTETIVHMDLPKDFYEDFRAAKTGDKQVDVTYESDPPHAVVRVKIT